MNTPETIYVAGHPDMVGSAIVRQLLAADHIVTRSRAELAPQSMSEQALLTGPLEATNEPYAIAKIAGIKLCESYNRQFGTSHGVDYRSVMPTALMFPYAMRVHAMHPHGACPLNNPIRCGC